MNGTMVFRCVACLAFLAMLVLPDRLSATGSDSGKVERVKKTSFGKLPDGTEIQHTANEAAAGAR